MLYAVRDGIRAASMNYGIAECEIMDDGKPPPRCGNWFVAIHEGQDRSTSDNQFQEYLAFLVTLTMRVTVPLDRVGDQQLSRNLARDIARKQGFYAKRDQIAKYLHMNWARVVLTGQTPPSANDNLSAWLSGTVYGFNEPMRYRGSNIAKLVGGEWFASDPESEDMGIVSELRFDGARRFQPQTNAQGPFV